MPHPAAAPGPLWQPAALPGAVERALVSRDGLAYRIFLIGPNGPPPEGGYPVLYVLDGNAVFGTLHDQMRTQARAEGGRLGPGLVVAVGYPTDAPLDMPRRAMDLTPAPATPGRGAFTWLAPEETGGAARFLAFLEDELKGTVAAEFPVNPHRLGLMGHSFGGLFTLHVLLTRPAAFESYLAASPSLWWADRAVARQAAGLARLPLPAGAPPRRLLLTVGGYEQEADPAARAGPGGAALEARLAERRMVDEAGALAARLGALSGREVEVTFETQAGQTHASAAPLALIRGLSFFFGRDYGSAP